MQIKFLTIYHGFDDEITSKRYAQESLIYMWQRSVQTQQVKFISSAKVEFKDYNIIEYPNHYHARFRRFFLVLHALHRSQERPGPVRPRAIKALAAG